MSEKKAQCAFCGEYYKKDDPSSDAVFFNATNVEDVYICGECVKKAYKFLGKKRDVKKKDDNLTPEEIKNFLDQYVIGQETAKKILSVASYNHMKMLDYYDHNKENKDKAVEVEKSNICLVGPSGMGKTHIVKNLARIFDVPFAIADATSLTESGYVGADVESVLQKLINAANGDIKKAERGIIFIDEIDKKANPAAESRNITKDVNGMGVQQALLKLIEGSIVDVPLSGRRLNPEGDNVQIDTSKILFIVGGAFNGIENIIKKRLNFKESNPIGISLCTDNKEEKLGKDVGYNDVIDQINHEDLRKFGLIPEFLGRLPIICSLKELTEDEMCKVLTEPKNALIKQYKEIMKCDNVELNFTDEAVKAIANKAIKSKTGARSLRSIMEKILNESMYIAPSKAKQCKESKSNYVISITEDVVNNNKKPEFVLKQREEKKNNEARKTVVQ